MHTTRCLAITLLPLALAACVGPLPHPVVLADVGQLKVGAAVQTLSAALQFDGMAQVGVLPHLQLEAQGGIDIWAEWQIQAGLRGELWLDDENGLQLAGLYDHVYSYSFSCHSEVALAFGGGDTSCPSVTLNAGGIELGWAHEFGRATRGASAGRRWVCSWSFWVAKANVPRTPARSSWFKRASRRSFPRGTADSRGS